MTGKSAHQTQNATPKSAISLSQPGILQRTCECGGVPGLTGECEECSSKRLSGQRGTNLPGLSGSPPDEMGRSHLGGYRFGEMAIAPKERLGVQAKLAIGQPGDKYEQEADRVAEQVMRMPDPASIAKPQMQRSPLGGYSFGNLAISPKERLGIQTRLAIGQPGDRYEQEADRVAEQVMRNYSSQPSPPMPLNLQKDRNTVFSVFAVPQPTRPQISPLLQVNSSLTESDEVSESDAEPKASLPDAISSLDTLEQNLVQREGAGHSLPGSTRQLMESKFGTDFRGVRVHTDTIASQMNTALQSHAFTHQQNIYFAPGTYRPGTPEGDKLLAHELTHVIQQSGGAETPIANNQGTLHLQRFEIKVYSGRGIHKNIEDALRAKNNNLITEAPIPGGTTNQVSFDKVGRADLYTSDNPGKVSGVQGDYPDKGQGLPEEQVKLNRTYKRFRSNATKGQVGYSPDFVSENVPFKGNFPDKFYVADLKPLDVKIFIEEKIGLGGKIGEGMAQISNYKLGFAEFAQQAYKDKKVLTQPQTTGYNLSKLDIPQGLDYRKFKQEASSSSPGEGSLIAGESRYWLYPVPEWGLYVYFTLPHPFPFNDPHAQKFKAAIDKTFTELKKVTAGLQKNHLKKTVNPHLSPKYRTSTPKPLLTKYQKLSPAKSSCRPIVQRKQGPQVDWKSEGQKWEDQREKWDKEYGKAFLEKEEGSVKALEHWVAINKALNLDPGTAGTAEFKQQFKELKSIKLWSGASGKLLGKARFLLGETFDKIIEFFEKVKEKFGKLRKKAEGTSDKGGVSWQSKVIKVLIKAAKVGFAELLKALYRLFANCFTGVMENVINKFTHDIDEALAERLKGVHEIFEEFRKKLEPQLQELEKYEKIITVLNDISYWTNVVTAAIWTIRGIIQGVSCLSPPAAGCLWGLVANLASEVALAIGIDLILDTQTFKEKIIQPAIQDLLKEYAGEEIQGLISSALETVGLQEYAKGVDACVIKGSPKPLGQFIPAPTGGLQGAALIQHRDQWEKKHQSEIFKDLKPKMQIGTGKTPSDAELAKFFEQIKKRNMTSEQLHDLFEKSKDSETDKYDIGKIRNIDYKKAKRSNKEYQKIIGWNPSQFCQKPDCQVDSEEFADAVYDFQKANGMKADGILGPETVITFYEKNNLKKDFVYQEAVRVREEGKAEKEKVKGDKSKEKPTATFKLLNGPDYAIKDKDKFQSVPKSVEIYLHSPDYRELVKEAKNPGAVTLDIYVEGTHTYRIQNVSVESVKRGEILAVPDNIPILILTLKDGIQINIKDEEMILQQRIWRVD